MFFNSLTWKQRCLLGLGALFITIPMSLHLNEVNEARRFARNGAIAEARVTEVHANPKDSRAYSVYRYSYNDREHTGTLAGAHGRAIGERLRITIDPESPGRSWPGDAKADLGELIWWSVLGAVWLAAGVAFVAGPRKEPSFPKGHLLSE